MAVACRERVLNCFSPTLQAGRFTELYTDLLRHPPAVESARVYTNSEMPTEIDMGPKSRVAMDEIFKYIVDSITAKLKERKLKHGGRSRLKRELKSELARVGMTLELLDYLKKFYSLFTKKKPSLWQRWKNAFINLFQ
jgi:hypothetical protein